MKSNTELKKIAAKAIEKEYGFSPSQGAITLLEADGDGIYILFRMGKHEFRLIDGKLTDVTLEKEKDEAVAATYSFYIEREKKYQFAEVERAELRKELEALRDENDELKKQQEKQENLFSTKEIMLTDAYNAKRHEIEILNGQIRFFQSLADDRLEEIRRLEQKNAELKKEIEVLKEAEELLKKYRKNCGDQQTTINMLKRDLKKMTVERNQLRTALSEAR